MYNTVLKFHMYNSILKLRSTHYFNNVWRMISPKIRRIIIYMIPNPAKVYGNAFFWDRKNFYFAPERLIFNDEIETYKTIKRILHEGQNFVDIGAHIGLFSIFAAKIVGDRGRVYAFEPHPISYSLLKRNIKANKLANVAAFPYAISDGPGERFLHLDERDAGESSIRPIKEASRMHRFKVQVTSLDQFFREKCVSVNLIKMDIEGGELEALGGMKLLARSNPGMKLIIEFNPNIQYTLGIEKSAFFAELRGLGFSEFTCLEHKQKGYDHNDPIEQPVNYLCE